MDIRSLKKVTAKKGHICSFSGRQIFPGEFYWNISYVHPLEGDNHETYKVSEEEFEQFVKEKLHMCYSPDYSQMEAEVLLNKVAGTRPNLTKLFGDIPNFVQKKDRLYRNLKADRKVTNY
jgi:hypothetical protein